MTVTEFILTESGLAVPRPPEPAPPPRLYGLLEMRDENDRKLLDHTLSHLLNSSYCASRRGFNLSSADVVEARRSLLLHVAYQLLGDDWDYEELC